MGSPATQLDRALLLTAAHHLRPIAGLIAAADPDASVSPRSRMLCAGLACLARACYAALGGQLHAEAVGEAAAMLSLLTKIDDQVIDALEFHGGPLARDRDPIALDRRTRAYLAPTLASLRAAAPATAEPRCALAAALGQRLRALACSRERLDHLLDTIALGWEVQVRAVRLLSSDPTRVDPAAIEAVTADISGAWLLMVTMIGGLPEDAARPVNAREAAAFYRWGLHIQSADALADLHKDTADGLVASRPGVRLASVEPRLWRGALVDAELGPLYRGVCAAGIDLAMLPGAGELDGLTDALAQLGMVPTWLRWIHGFLAWRWLMHPACPRELDEAQLDALFPDRLGRELGRGWAGGWARWQRAMTLADQDTKQPEIAACSGR
ncbi:hypothetical protein DB30_07229 [Enhygromyxa salina]|uniref:Uncharacterized protein n=1 Tax=Enhygromyxa salina TaxID=215803 RepID=A0A0C2A690_9BACT|nr:hypothetical protein [Enhygromyxa salina]KIG18893.1 hypothetical protein DB30_07229 [Enhygromyxa salina]